MSVFIALIWNPLITNDIMHGKISCYLPEIILVNIAANLDNWCSWVPKIHKNSYFIQGFERRNKRWNSWVIRKIKHSSFKALQHISSICLIGHKVRVRVKSKSRVDSSVDIKGPRIGLVNFIGILSYIFSFYYYYVIYVYVILCYLLVII